MIIVYFLLFGQALARNFISEVKSEIPRTFDAREKWKKCHSIRFVPNEASCRSSWAYIPASVLSDRICIYSYSKIKVTLSAQEVLACAPEGNGCRGGTIDAAWNYLTKHGASTGGEYDSEEGCQPYDVPACSATGKSAGDLSPCSPELSETPVCQEKCTNEGYETAYQDDIYRARAFYKIPSEEAAIQSEIMGNGPVQATILLYDDLYDYKEGIYGFWSGKFLGVQNVKIVGWSQDEYENTYWIVVNTWGNEWGVKGAFNVTRGVNYLGIEDNVYGVEPLVTHQ